MRSRIARRTMAMDHPHIQLATDAAIATGAVTLPMWINMASAWAGAITILLGAMLVFIRLIIAIRDWRRGRGMDEYNVD